jgi:hypothetical protein
MATRSTALVRLLLACSLPAALAAAAQAPPQRQVPLAVAAPTGTVTGTVLAEDTQRPVRFALVLLQSTAAGTGAGYPGRGSGGGAQARTEVDGAFTATGVPPGDYYVIASAPGYIPERSRLQAAIAAGADPDTLLAAIPVVHVSADATSTVNLSLERGAGISGRLQWEDGSPAAGHPHPHPAAAARRAAAPPVSRRPERLRSH